MTETAAPLRHDVLDPDRVGPRTRYELLTSLVVPRPIGWLSTWGPDGVANLAPFSYFSALSSSPMLVGASIGHRRSGPKDTLVNVRAREAFCANVVTERHLEAMNLTSADVPPSVDEFASAGLEVAEATAVDAPFVADAPAVLECSLVKEVELDGAPNTLIVGRVRRVHLARSLERIAGREAVDTDSLRPVGRLWGGGYSLTGEIRHVPRPR